MAPSSERLLLRPSVEARVQLDCVELLCVPAEPVCGCQRGLVQDRVPVVVAPSRRPDPDVTHSSPIAGTFCPPSHAGGGLPNPSSSSRPIDRAPVAASRPRNAAPRDLGFHRAGGGNRSTNISTRATIGDGNALAVEVNLFRHTYNTLRPHQALDERTPRAAYSPSNTAISVWPLADPLLDWEVLT